MNIQYPAQDYLREEITRHTFRRYPESSSYMLLNKPNAEEIFAQMLDPKRYISATSKDGKFLGYLGIADINDTTVSKSDPDVKRYFGLFDRIRLLLRNAKFMRPPEKNTLLIWAIFILQENDVFYAGSKLFEKANEVAVDRGLAGLTFIALTPREKSDPTSSRYLELLEDLGFHAIDHDTFDSGPVMSLTAYVKWF